MKPTAQDEDSEDTVEAQLMYEGLRYCEMAVNASEQMHGERPNHDQGEVLSAALSTDRKRI